MEFPDIPFKYFLHLVQEEGYWSLTQPYPQSSAPIKLLKILVGVKGISLNTFEGF